MKELWVEKYRPSKIKDYVWRDDAQKRQVETWVTDKSIPHLLLSGGPGTGKTTLARVLKNELEVDDADFMQINASRDNGVELMRQKITNFGQTMPFGEYKIIFLDEADYISQAGQAILRGIMEEYHETLRFILTCNYSNKIIPAIHSRTQGFHIQTLDQTEFTVRAGQILAEEGVEFDMPTLDIFVKANYPDLRKTINSIQMCVADSKLHAPSKDDANEADYRLQMVALFREGKYKEARKLICSQASLEEYEDIFRFMYRNLDFWGQTEEQQDEAIIIIRNGLVKHSQIADPEINLSATLIELEGIKK